MRVTVLHKDEGSWERKANFIALALRVDKILAICNTYVTAILPPKYISYALITFKIKLQWKTLHFIITKHERDFKNPKNFYFAICFGNIFPHRTLEIQKCFLHDSITAWNISSIKHRIQYIKYKLCFIHLQKKNLILYSNKALKNSICFLLIQALMDKQTLLSG